MEIETFHDMKKSLLLLAGDPEKMEDFNAQYQSAVIDLAKGLISPDTEIQAKSRDQIAELRRIAGIQVRYLIEQKREALGEELSRLDEDAFIKA